MTEQETFDKVKNHLLTQNKQSLDWPQCRYRDKEGLKCAVGCLIPDEEYTTDIEGKSVGFGQLIDTLPSIKGLNLILLRNLQVVHDSYEPSRWIDRLQDLAKKMGTEV